MDRARDPLTAAIPESAVRRLLAEAGAGTEFTTHSLPGGGNNRVFRVETATASFLLKAYFQHPQDRRDRLGVEFAFSRFAWDCGVHWVPRPFASLPKHGLALYEFVLGVPVRAGEVEAHEVDQALSFYRDLNCHRQHPDAPRLAAGSEACFSLGEHLDTIARRLQRLREWQPSTSVDHDAKEFVERELLPRWHAVREETERLARTVPVELDQPLAGESRRLSPSDFGFHNALRESSGQLRFLDFEYAGWDDPAKLVCDFFCQPAVPVPAKFWSHFLNAVAADLPKPESEYKRFELLWVPYRLKWVAILLNEFLAAGDHRRRFARPDQDPEERKAYQLAKARHALDEALR